MTGDCCVFKFLRRSVDGKYLMRLQSETSVFKFLLCSVDEALNFEIIYSPMCTKFVMIEVTNSTVTERNLTRNNQ